MRIKAKLRWIVGVALAILVCTSGQMCSFLGGSGLAGTYTGTATVTRDLTLPGATEPLSSSSEIAFEITLTDSGQPQTLMLPGLNDSPTGAMSDIFAEGQSRTFTETVESGSGSSMISVTLTTTVTVREATFSSTGFHVIYDIVSDTAYSGSNPVVDGTSVHTVATAEYTGTVTGNVLTYSSKISEDLTSGSSQGTHLDRTFDAQLTRQ